MHKFILASILSVGVSVGIAGSAGAMSLAGGSAQTMDRAGTPILQVKESCRHIADARRRHTCELQMTRHGHKGSGKR
jgi:hypothetical protein